MNTEHKVNTKNIQNIQEKAANGIRLNLANNSVVTMKVVLLSIKWLCYHLFVSDFMTH